MEEREVSDFVAFAHKDMFKHYDGYLIEGFDLVETVRQLQAKQPGYLATQRKIKSRMVNSETGGFNSFNAVALDNSSNAASPKAEEVSNYNFILQMIVREPSNNIGWQSIIHMRMLQDERGQSRVSVVHLQSLNKFLTLLKKHRTVAEQLDFLVSSGECHYTSEYLKN